MGIGFRKFGNKYNNHKVECDGMTFDSEKERDRYLVLKAYEKQGVISDLRCQVYYELLPKAYYLRPKQLKTKVRYDKLELYDKEGYKADFVYTSNGDTIVEDVKGSKAVITDKFKLKQKLMFAVHGIVVHTVFKASDGPCVNPMLEK